MILEIGDGGDGYLQYLGNVNHYDNQTTHPYYDRNVADALRLDDEIPAQRPELRRMLAVHADDHQEADYVSTRTRSIRYGGFDLTSPSNADLILVQDCLPYQAYLEQHDDQGPNFTNP
ncbi:MAG: hypothetical protein K0U52_06715 [Gammaproteobacteria bacterium]|nr:hypothetical protein [Gammaproteobacteria bacterium]